MQNLLANGSGALEWAKEVHVRALKERQRFNVHVANPVIMCVKCSSVVEAQNFFLDA